ncbi:tRNA epoxyqueuosine(34) reductase QueG [Thiohalomonas denitrificans]|uniref:Epoxyqueuosine reductase n=1 Tax=Thiohalomonas denitrificans TaxID=415747 RepID=A0A1G5PKG4_9GAMM|nr:tRNA epoxyqueuosine(34) reductase QueG [Thiohalomonas denitrificans]SCZ49856.1 epoxyqueuosine reductase [Thiohalomonas denitrificans]
MAISYNMDRQNLEPNDLARHIRSWGRELGFQAVGITDIDLSAAERRFLDWLKAGFHGEMEYMARHGTRRSRPPELVEGTCRVISVRMDYRPAGAADADAVLADSRQGYISRYALGRDYHKLMRKRLANLAKRIEAAVGPFGHRVFVDSAPVLEKPLAEKAGLGWVGKHSNLLHREGSWFFLGEIYVDLPLPIDTATEPHCGSCRACIDACPTRAIVAPYVVDARLCISYLTIELHGSIPEELRPLIGNRIYGCDDCQLCCPWNRFTANTAEGDFEPRHELDSTSLVELFAWDEARFLQRTEGSAIRRLGHERWLRNIAVALGNAPAEPAIIEALQARREACSPLVREHVEWALGQHGIETPESAG